MAIHLAGIAAHDAPRDAKPEASLAAAYPPALLGWLLSAGVYIAAKWVSVEMPPWALCFWRLSLAGLFLLPIVRHHFGEMGRLLATRFLPLLSVGVILAVCQGFIFMGLQTTTATTAGIIMALAPIFTLVMAHFLVGEAMGVRQGLGAAIAVAGMLTIVARGDFSTLLAMDFNLGELWVVGGALTFALYTVLLRRFRFGIDRMALLVLLLGLGALTALPVYLWEILSDERSILDTSGLLALAYAAIPGGAIMYFLFNSSVDALGASRAGMLMYLQAGFVAVLAYLFLGEELKPYDMVGAAVIIIGIVTAVLPGREKTAKA